MLGSWVSFTERKNIEMEKKNNKIRKRVLSLLVLLSCIILVTGCGGIGMAGEIIRELQKHKIKYEDFEEYLGETIEITTENWNKYFIVYVMEGTQDDTLPYAELGFVLKDGYIIDPLYEAPCFVINDTVIDKSMSYGDFLGIYNYYDLVCQDASGYIRECDLPQEEWNVLVEDEYMTIEVHLPDGSKQNIGMGNELANSWGEEDYFKYKKLKRPEDLPFYVKMPENAGTFHYSPKFGDMYGFDLVYDADLVVPASIDSWTYGWLAEDTQNTSDSCASFYVVSGNYEDFYAGEYQKYFDGKMYSNVEISEKKELKLNAYDGYYWSLSFEVGDLSTTLYYYAVQLDEERYFYICVGDSYLDGRITPSQFFKGFIYDIVVY